MLEDHAKALFIVPVASGEQRRQASLVEFAAFEKDRQDGMVARLDHVVRRFTIVRIGATLQQQPCQAGGLCHCGSAVDCGLKLGARIGVIDRLGSSPYWGSRRHRAKRAR